MTRISMASFSKSQRAGYCVVLSAFACAWSAPCGAKSAEPASLSPPPPAIVLGTAPPPELPAVEWARRPFELALDLSLALPDCADGSVNDQRCTGLSRGGGVGLNALWRLSPYFAWGAGGSALGFAFSPAPSSGLSGASAGGIFVGFLGRAYLLERGAFEPYLELGLGGGAVRTSAKESGAAYRETAGGGAVRVGIGGELYLSEHLRLGPAASWTRFHVGHVERCSVSDCVDLNVEGSGHGVGFSTLSLRFSVLFGDAL